MADRQIIRRRSPFSQGKTVPVRFHSETDVTKHLPLISPLKLKTEHNKYIKSSSNHLPMSEQSNMNVQQILKKGKQLFSQQKFDESIAHLKPLLNTSKEIESLYYIGCSFFYKEKYEHSIYYLNLLIQKQPHFNRNGFIILAVAYKQLNLLKPAIRILNKCMDNFREFEECIIYLAKLHMKLREFNTALSLLEAQVNGSSSMVLRLTYADCLRLCNRIDESIKQYNIISKDKDLGIIGILKRMTANYDIQKYALSLSDCNQLLSKKVESSQVFYFKGMNLLKLNYTEQFPVQFSKSLDLNTHQLAVTNSLCEIVKNHISRKDIYSAELEIKRIEYLNIRQQQIRCLKLFVEGAIDCVKKRSQDAISKLSQVQKLLKSRSYNYSSIIEENIKQYLGYAYFLQSDYPKALKYYSMQKHQPTSMQYNKLLCEGIIQHQHHDYTGCNSKISFAKTLIPHFEPYFYLSINYVQQYFSNNNISLLDDAVVELEIGCEYNPSSLYYFYLTLVLMQAKRPADQTIALAIEKSDDNVADYYFVRGIVEAQNDLTLALNDFTTAIEMLQIPAYYKERSKCMYQLGMYNLAIEDLLKLLTIQKDYEASMLLTFNYYANEQYQLSLRTLQQIFINQQNQYLLGLKISLNIHLKNYKKAGTLGQLILSMLTNTKILDQTILDKFQLILEQKATIGQFDPVQLLCLGGTYHFVHGDFEKSQICFYSALNQLKLLLSKNTNIDFGVEAKIYQSKFNIALAHLMMKEYGESIKLLGVLIDETESQNTVQELRRLLDFVKIEVDESIKMSIDADETIIDIFPNYKLLSQKFPVSKIRFKNAVLVIKPILFYPEKIKFNIVPELNSRFLKQFGIWKVDNIPQPPWVIREGSSFQFTNNIQTDIPPVEYTQTNYDPQSSIDVTYRSPVESSIAIRDKLKLPDGVSDKLQKIINKAPE